MAIDHSKDPETLAIAAAVAELERSGMKKIEIAAAAGLSSTDLLFQWETGRRTVPAKRAVVVAKALRLRPDQVSAKYRECLDATGVAQQSQPQPIADLSALDVALGAFASAMKVHRPTEARDVARTIRREAPLEMQASGLLRQLLAILDGEAAKAEA